MPKPRHHARTATLVIACALSFSSANAQITVQPVTTERDAPVEELSRVQFAQHVQQLQQFVSSCKATAKACGQASIPSDDHVSAGQQGSSFLEHWNWLRAALKSAAEAKPDERATAMNDSAEHLQELLAEASGSAPGPPKIDGAQAQKKAAQVLARSEFRKAVAAQPSWLDRQMARFQTWFASLFMGISRLGAAAPWLGKLLEWGLFVLAAAGLLLFIKRSFARQQLQINMNAGALQLGAWDREANDWAAEADACAADGKWRDAVHCLYWAAIVRLEARRAWRHNPARTPREYVRLLQTGSTQHNALRGLTGLLERVWYGLRDAGPQDYEQAKSLFSQLSKEASAFGSGAQHAGAI